LRALVDGSCTKGSPTTHLLLADRCVQIFEGVEATNRLFLKGLEAQHIKKFDPTDEKFDPNLHQAMFEMPAGRPPRPPYPTIQAFLLLEP
jgi:hypothetical protein